MSTLVSDVATAFDMEIAAKLLVTLIESFTGHNLHTHVFSGHTGQTFEGRISTFYGRVIAYLEDQRRLSPEVFATSQVCTVLIKCLEDLCHRYLTYKRDFADSNNSETTLKKIAQKFIYPLGLLVGTRVQGLAEEYAEFHTLYYLCCIAQGTTDFVLLEQYIQKWPKEAGFEWFVYNEWLHSLNCHRYFFDPRMSAHRPEMQAFLCCKEHISELSVDFVVEFAGLADPACAVTVVNTLAYLAWDTLLASPADSEASVVTARVMDFVALAKLIFVAKDLIGTTAMAAHAVIKFIELLVGVQANCTAIELDPERVLTNAILVGSGSGSGDSSSDDDDDGEEEEEDESDLKLRTALDFVHSFGVVLGCAGNVAGQFVVAYCECLDNKSYGSDKDSAMKKLYGIVFEHAYEATRWEQLAALSDKAAALRYLNTCPVVSLGRYAYFTLGVQKQFLCDVVQSVAKGENLFPVTLDLMFARYDIETFPASVDNDNDNDEEMVDADNDNDDDDEF